MKFAYVFGLAAALLCFVERGSAQSPFYSADEYQLGHSVFDKLLDRFTGRSGQHARRLEQSSARRGEHTRKELGQCRLR